MGIFLKKPQINVNIWHLKKKNRFDQAKKKFKFKHVDTFGILESFVVKQRVVKCFYISCVQVVKLL